MGLSGPKGYSVGKQRPPDDSLPRLYWDLKTLLPRSGESRSLIPMVIMRQFADKWMGITQDPSMLGTIQRHLLQFNKKSPQVKPTCRCEVKVPRTQESMMASEVRSMLSEGTIEVDTGSKGFFTYPFLIPKKKRKSHFIMNQKLLN